MATERKTAGWGIWIKVVVSVVLFAAFVGVFCPNYLTQSSKLKQPEAVNNLHVIAKGQSAYRHDHGRYARTFDELGIELAKNRRYTYFIGDDVLTPDLPGKRAVQSDDFPRVLKEYLAYRGGPGGFTAVAISDLDGDPDLDVWVVDDHGTVRHLMDDARVTWKDILLRGRDN